MIPFRGMKEKVVLTEEAKGWRLDCSDGCIYDGLESEEQARELAADMDWEITSVKLLPVSPKTPKVSQLKPEDLFRIDGHWYRLIKHENKKAICNVVGTNTTDTISGNTRITELSVLSRN